jgi:channel protein (hemolysin III family)
MSGSTIMPFAGFSEPFSSMTHLFAAGIFLLFGIVLLREARDNLITFIACSIFIISGVFLLSMSGVFHLIATQSSASDVIQRLDHAGIFFLIAGTFTAVHAVLFRGFWRWGMLLLIWGIAITAITLGAYSLPWHGMAGSHLWRIDLSPLWRTLYQTPALWCSGVYSGRRD